MGEGTSAGGIPDWHHLPRQHHAIARGVRTGRPVGIVAPQRAQHTALHAKAKLHEPAYARKMFLTLGDRRMAANPTARCTPCASLPPPLRPVSAAPLMRPHPQVRGGQLSGHPSGAAALAVLFADALGRRNFEVQPRMPVCLPCSLDSRGVVRAAVAVLRVGRSSQPSRPSADRADIVDGRQLGREEERTAGSLGAAGRSWAPQYSFAMARSVFSSKWREEARRWQIRRVLESLDCGASGSCTTLTSASTRRNPELGPSSTTRCTLALGVSAGTSNTCDAEHVLPWIWNPSITGVSSRRPPPPALLWHVTSRAEQSTGCFALPLSATATWNRRAAPPGSATARSQPLRPSTMSSLKENAGAAALPALSAPSGPARGAAPATTSPPVASRGAVCATAQPAMPGARESPRESAPGDDACGGGPRCPLPTRSPHKDHPVLQIAKTARSSLTLNRPKFDGLFVVLMFVRERVHGGMGGFRSQEEAEGWVAGQAQAAGCDVLDAALAAKLGARPAAPAPPCARPRPPGFCICILREEAEGAAQTGQMPRTRWRGASSFTTRWSTRTRPTRRRASTSAATRWGCSP